MFFFAFLLEANLQVSTLLLQCTNGPLPLAPPVHMTASDTKSFDLSLSYLEGMHDSLCDSGTGFTAQDRITSSGSTSAYLLLTAATGQTERYIPANCCYTGQTERYIPANCCYTGQTERYIPAVQYSPSHSNKSLASSLIRTG